MIIKRRRPRSDAWPRSGKRRILVLGERASVAVTACRALGAAGYEVGVASWREVEEAGLSRFAKRNYRVPPLHEAVGAWTDAVRRIVHFDGYDVAIATTDAAVARLPDMHLAIPTCPQISARHSGLIDKALLGDLCRQASVAYPRTHRPGTAADDEAAARDVRSRTVVKAVRSAMVASNHVNLAPGANVVRDPHSALRALTALRKRGIDSIIQEYLAGEKFQAVIIRRAGTTSCRLAFQVLREFPPAAGSETALAGLSAAGGTGAEIVGMLERLADAAGYEGLLQAEFIKSSGDGRIRVIDVNPRLWGSLKFAELLGFRMTERAVRDALGLAPAQQEPDPAGRRYHHVARELRWLLARGRVPRAYFSTFSFRDVWDVPSLTDPRPDLLRFKRMLLGRPHGRARPDRS